MLFVQFFLVFVASLSSLSFSLAQDLSFTIDNVAAPSTVDLSNSLGNRTGEKFTWGMTLPIFDETPFDTSVELMSGSPNSSDASVVDIVGKIFLFLPFLSYNLNALAGCNFTTSTGIFYVFPTNLKTGQYFVRINATVQAFDASGTRLNKFLSHSANSNGINVTSNNNPPIGCGSGKTPDTFAAITSNTTAPYTSFILLQPQPGTNVFVDSQNVSTGSIAMAWNWRNGANILTEDFTFNGGISNFTVTVQNSGDGTIVGKPQQIGLTESNSLPLEFADYPVKAGESYKLIVTYNNEVQDGPVAPGGLVTFTSGEFNVISAGTNCSTGSTSSANGGGSSSDGGKPSAASVLQPSGLLLVIFLSLVWASL
jgi:hypothetical protein